MPIFKSITEKIRLLIVFLAICAILYGTAYAVINRIVGIDLWDGQGLVLRGQSGGKDSLHVLYGWFTQLNTDSVGPDTTKLKNVFSTATHTHTNIDSTWIANAGIGNSDLADNAVYNTECAPIDSTWITSGSIATTTIRDGGIFGVDIATYTVDSSKITNTVLKAIKETNRPVSEYMTGYFMLQEGTDISITKNDSAMVIAYSGAGGGAWYGQGISGGTLTTDTMCWLPEWGILMRETNPAAVRDTIAVKADSGTIRNYLDNIWQANIKDSTWFSSVWGGAELAIWSTNSDSISIYYPLADSKIDFFVKNINESGGANDQMDTIVFSGTLPSEIIDIDSVTYPYRTSSTTADSAGLQVVIFKRTTLLGDTVRIYTGTNTASSFVWSHQAIAGASISAIAGKNKIAIWMISTIDKADTVDYGKPLVWYQGK